MDQQFFTKQLLKWAKNINRPMPWKGEKKSILHMVVRNNFTTNSR